ARDCIWTGGDVELPAGRASETGEIGAAEQQLIAASDTFFIASAHRTDRGESGGLDVSHRGGRPGFIRIDDPKHLTIPDFAGNLYFNTLGNLVEEPRCCLLFLDFATGDRIQIAARGEILWDSPERA